MSDLDNRPSSTVNVTWQGGFEFLSRDAYGNTITVNVPQSKGEKFLGFMPGDMMMTSLVGCSGVDVVEILRKQRQDIRSIEITATGVQQPNPPWTWEEVRLEYVVTGKNISETAVERAIRLSETKYCSVGATLAGRARISSTFKILQL